MDKDSVVKLASRDTVLDPLTELLKTGAELLELLAEHSWRRSDDGKAGVVRTAICRPASCRRV